MLVFIRKLAQVLNSSQVLNHLTTSPLSFSWVLPHLPVAHHASAKFHTCCQLPTLCVELAFSALNTLVALTTNYSFSLDRFFSHSNHCTVAPFSQHIYSAIAHSGAEVCRRHWHTELVHECRTMPSCRRWRRCQLRSRRRRRRHRRLPNVGQNLWFIWKFEIIWFLLCAS